MGLFQVIKFFYYFVISTQKKIYNFLFPTAIILLYHRIDNINQDPHRLAVSAQNFEDQIRFLKDNFNIIELSELVSDLKNKKLRRHSIVITFDDGYADNFFNVLPILKKYQVPATIFITSGMINNPESFYWEKIMPEQDRGRALKINELKELSSSELIEIGAHTINHPKLAKISTDEQWSEIEQSKIGLEKILNRSIDSFAYPFGGKDSFDQKTINLVKKAGFNYACANIHQRITNKSNKFALPRYVIRNWDFKQFKKEFKKFI